MHLRERNYNKEVIVIFLLKCKLKRIAKPDADVLIESLLRLWLVSSDCLKSVIINIPVVKRYRKRLKCRQLLMLKTVHSNLDESDCVKFLVF